MDAKGARDLARRIGDTTGVVPRPVPADVPEGSLPLYRWFGGGTAAKASDASEPVSPSPRLRRLRKRGR